MKKLKLLLMTAGLLLSAQGLKAQSDYRTALGIRLGYSNGITVKHFVSGQDAFEGILSTRWRGFQFTGLYERHFNAFKVPELKLFVGGGGHIGSYHSGYYHHVHDDHHHPTYFGNAGLDGILGIEYTFRNAPINLGLDIKPSIDLWHMSPIYMGAGFSIRYTFK